jgi:hypothetical protein
VLTQYGGSLRQGAVFYDADAREPHLLWLHKSAVEDGRGQVIGERLFAIHRAGGVYRKSQPYALLDLKDPDQPPAVPAELRQAAADEDAVIEWSLDAVVAPYFQEIQQRRARELAIREKYVRMSLQYLISESVKKIARYDADLRQLGAEENERRLSIQGHRGKKDARRQELLHRRQERLAEIEQERHLSEKPPELLGVCVVLPVPAEVTANVGGMTSDPEIEAIAIRTVLDYERGQGRSPVSVESENCGWDITSLAGGEVDRYIEVKGRATTGAVALTPNEWIKAQRFGKDYWLYVVANCSTSPELYLIQDPASKLRPTEEVSVVRFVVNLADWQRAALHAGQTGPAEKTESTGNPTMN